MNFSSKKSGNYVAALRTELTDAGSGRRALALLNQRVLFPHRGTANLFQDELELDGWDERGSIAVIRGSVSRIARQFDDRYGAFIGGGSSRWGAPVIIELQDGTALYLLFNHRTFLEKTDNPEWEAALLEWRA